MKNKPRRVFERVYIHAAKVQVQEGWVLILHAMDAVSEFAFHPAYNSNAPEVTVDALNQLFDNILKDYNPFKHPKQIVFVTNLPEEFESLIQQTKATHHRFVFNPEVTKKAMKGLFSHMKYNIEAL